MAAIGRSSTPTAKQTAAAERVAKFTEEQHRLKAAAADRRAAAAAAPSEEARGRFVAKGASPPAPARPSQYLQ